MAGTDIGIDLGTGSVTVYVRGKGVVLSQATAISYDTYTDEVVAVGDSAKRMLERMPETVSLTLPIRGGVISDFSAAKQILSLVIEKICKRRVLKPNIIISTPSSVTELQKKSVIDAACAAGAGKAAVIDEPVASAVGAGLDIDNPRGKMVVDIGAGTSDIAVITMGQAAYCSSLRVAGDDMDEAVCQYLKKERDIVIGRPTAEKIKKTVGCASDGEEEIEMAANGKNYVSGMPVMFTVTSKEVREATNECVESILEEMRNVMEALPPELYSDICYEGILLTGGGSRLRGLEQRVAERFGIDVNCSADPENCAAKGAGIALERIGEFEDRGLIFKIKENQSFGL